MIAILRNLRKLRNRSLAEFRERALQKVSALMEAYGLTYTSGEPTDEELCRLLDPASPAAQPFVERLAHFRTREEPKFFAGIRDGSAADALRGDRWKHERARLIAAAERIIAGSYDLLGHGALSFGSPIDWHFDPTTNRRSPRTHWSRISYLDVDVVGDHKVVWEINRHQHFVVLGRAYQVTGDNRYARCFVDQLVSWMDANPSTQGVNWASSLEVGYRAISWLWALELFRESTELDASLLSRMIKVLYLHGRHLERYLSTYFSPNTHLTGEALGLLYLGTMLPEFRRARHWRSAGWDILEKELYKQVHEDGVYFEQATYYHRYTLDIYLHAFLLARADGRAIPTAMSERLGVAAEHLADLTRPDGTIPIIGDDDGGRLLALEERAPTDVRAALSTSAVILDRPSLARVSGRPTEEVLWLLGPAGVRAAGAAADGEAPDHTSRLYPVGGFAIMRDGWGPRANHAVIDYGPHGSINCGHAHADALSLEIAMFGRAAIVDPGTFTYTGSQADRDHFRHSASHNTVTVDGDSSSVPAGAFSWSSRTHAWIESWWTGSFTDYFVGAHDGFVRRGDPVRHQRRVLFVRDSYWVIVDTLLAEGRHVTVAHLHAALDATVTQLSARSAYLDIGYGATGRRLLVTAAGDTETLTWEEDWVSPAYGKRALAPVARLTSAGVGRRDLVTVLVPINGDETVSVHELPCEGGHALVVQRTQGRDTLLFRRSDVLRADGLEMIADAAIVRRNSSTSVPSQVALFGRSAELIVGTRIFEARNAAEFHRVGENWSVQGEGRLVVRVQPPR